MVTIFDKDSESTAHNCGYLLARACEKVDTDLGLGGGFNQVLHLTFLMFLT